MDYLIWWMILLLIGSCQISGSKEVLDFLVVYKTPYESLWPPKNYVKKVKEYHRWGNTQGLLLKNGDDYIDSVEGMVPLNCAPATASCKWKLSDSWSFVAVNINADRNFTINAGDELEEEKDSCTENNGNCTVICRSENGRPQCYCPEGIRTVANSTCYPITRTEIIKSSTELVNYGLEPKPWLVVPPKNATTLLTVTTLEHRHSFVIVNVREVEGSKNQLLQIYDRYLRTKHVQSNYVLEVTLRSGRIRIDINFVRHHLTLTQDNGILNYDIFPVSNTICVSVIYRTPKNNGDITINITLANGTTYEVKKYTERQFDEWKQRTFISSSAQMTNGKVNLQLHVSGKGTTFHSIFGCNPYGQKEITVFANAVSVPTMSKHMRSFKDESGNCLNGGVYIKEAEICLCPEGFTGEKCEEGCGPHYFGHNCSRECSNFATGCSGMMFCKKHLSCLCASGFQGQFCEDGCNDGFYGPSCTQTCGHCQVGSCNRYTGYCHIGCQSGFARPSCHIPYKYSRISPTVTYQDIGAVTVEINTTEVEGVGESEYYQLQYKEAEEMTWTELQPERIDNISITTNITGLLPGVNYHTRVVYIDKDGNSYQETNVPKTAFSTLCTVPTSMDYNLTAISTSSSIELRWKYIIKKTDCPVMGYTIKLQRNWNKVLGNVSENRQHYTFDTLLPGMSYEVKIKVNTRFGEGPFSTSLIVKTKDDAPLHVTDLRATEIEPKKLRLSWKQPKFTGGALQEYWVKYKCTRFMACEEPCKDNTENIKVPANQTFVDLRGLRPHVQYFIAVAAMSYFPGPYTSIEAVTKESAPDAAPKMSPSPVVTSTNVTLTVQWLPLESCSLLNGYLRGYIYDFFSSNETVLTGMTSNTHATFNDLTPQTLYVIHVQAVSSGGWNKDKRLIIKASTAVTVPDKVQNLVAYKRGRRVIGVRWAQPVNTYGEIESFSVSYCRLNDCENAVTVRVPPTPCVPWPTFFCHTISNVLPNKEYSISVMARNVLVDDYGEAATINTVTSEGVPEVPSSLRMIARKSDTITLEWEPPRMFNGILRSYLINVEQIDSANSSHCCVYSPLLEVPVKSEEEKYTHELTDLMPSSKYIIGVSAKTISIGSSAFVTLSTSPEIPELMQPPTLVQNNLVKVPLGEDFRGINGTYLLLILLPNESTPSTSPIWNSEIAEKLESLIATNNFYIVAEYNAEDMELLRDEEWGTDPIEVEIGKGIAPRNGTMGVLENPILPSNFSVGLALVLDYNGALSVGFVSAVEATDSSKSELDHTVIDEEA